MMDEQNHEDEAAHRLWARGQCRFPLWDFDARPSHAYCCRPVVDRDAAGFRGRFCAQCIEVVARPVDAFGRPIRVADLPRHAAPPAPSKPRTGRIGIDEGTLRRLRDEGRSVQLIARHFRASETTITKAIARLGMPSGLAWRRPAKAELDEDQIRRLRAEGLSAAAIGARMGVSRMTILRAVERMGLATGRWRDAA